MDSNRKYVEEIMSLPAFDREAFQSMARQYFTDDKPEVIELFLKRQYLCEDFSEISRTHSLREVVDFLNRLIVSKDRYQRMSGWEKQQLCVISDEELDEFTRLAAETWEIPVAELAGTSPTLTGRSYFEMLRVGFDAIKLWDYPPDISTAFLYSEARCLSKNDPFKLLEEPDSIEEFAGRFQGLYHNEEIWFGGPGMVIHDESARVGSHAYTFTYRYTEWTGTFFSGSSYDIVKLYEAIKMYTALRKAGYPVYYGSAEEDRENYLKCLARVRCDNERLIEWSKQVERRVEYKKLREKEVRKMELKNDTMKGLKRTHYCGEVPLEPAEVTVCGFVDRVRDVGNIIFINLRDRTGLVQLAFNDETDREVFAKAQQVKSEYVLMAHGTIRDRDEANPKMKTGKVEVAVDDLRILAKAQTPPFEVTNSDKVNDELKLRYRYLDLRNPRLQKNLIMRHEIAKAAREYFYSNGFLEIETPMMMRSTPEGARDYLVPSRVHKGSFYALPQSPQIYKQLLMVSGYDRYVQIARCFRDEDLRADRQPEFTQIDLEMSFTDVDGLIAMGEGFIAHIMKQVLGREVALPLPRLTFADAMSRYGSDKPDTRFGMEIQNITEAVKGIEFPVFTGAVEAGGSVRAIVAEGAAAAYTRKEIDKLIEHAKGIGAKGLAYIRWTNEGANCSFKKFLADGDLEKITEALGAKEGDLVLIAADKDKVALPVLGALRLIIAKRLDMIPEDKFNFLVITEMPFFEYDDESGKWLAMHHPFTMPMEECLKDLDTDPASVRAQAFDFVVNGVELSSGSMRITDFELQQKMFEALGLTDEEIAAKFGFLVDAYRYAAPPHGGMGFGLDRISMMLCGADSLRDVVAFPKVQNASELMSACPSVVDSEQLEELGITVTAAEDSAE